MNTYVESLARVSTTLPKEPRNIIVSRKNLIEVAYRQLQGEYDAVFLTGDSGVGRTEVVRQFVELYPFDTLSIFIDPANSHSYNPEFIMIELSCQMGWLINKDDKFPEGEDPISVYRQRLSQLTRLRRGKKKHNPFIFAIDGLDRIPPERRQILDEIWDLLPVKLSGLSLLISGDVKIIPKRMDSMLVKPLEILPFSEDEAVLYFSDIDISSEIELELRSTFPLTSRLAAIRRLMQGGATADDILMARNSDDLYEMEIADVSEDNEPVIALVSLGDKLYTCPEIDRITGVPSGTADRTVAKLSFLEIDDKERVTVASESLRLYLCKKYESFRKDVDQWVIDDLMNDPDSLRSIERLPVYLQRNRQYDNVINYLTPERISSLYEQSRSVISTTSVLDIGLKSASDKNHINELLRFSMCRSALVELSAGAVWAPQVRALMELRKYDAAVLLANSAILKADQLQLLCTVARKQQELEGEVQPALLDQIFRLYDEVEPPSLGDRAVHIATELLFIDSERAIQLVEAAAAEDSGEHALDIAFIKLGLSAQRRHVKGEREDSEIMDTVRSRVEDPGLKRLSATLSVFLGGLTSQEVLSETDDIENDGDKLYLLRHWAVRNSRAEQAADVITKALDIITINPKYAQNVGLLRELSTPLPFIEDQSTLRTLVDRIQVQRKAADELGPAQETYRLDLLTSRAIHKYDPSDAKDKIIGIYLGAICEMDLALRLESLARCATVIRQLDPKQEWEGETGIHTEIQKGITEAIKLLLEGTASQYVGTRSALSALARTDAEQALEIAGWLNTAERRDAATRDIAIAIAKQQPSEVEPDKIWNALSKIEDPRHHTTAIVGCLQTISEHKDVDKENAIRLVEKLVSIVKKCDNTSSICESYRYLLLTLSKSEAKESDLVSNIACLLKEAWDMMDIGHHKVAEGYEAVAALARCDHESAEALLSHVETERLNINLDTSKGADTYSGCIDIALRCYGSLLDDSTDSTPDLERLRRLIDALQSARGRSRHWAHLGFLLAQKDKIKEARDIVRKHIRPLVGYISTADEGYKMRALIDVAPVLYAVEPLIVINEARQLNYPYRDEVLSSIADSVIYKKILGEPVDKKHGESFEIGPEDAYSILNLVEEMESDQLIHRYIKAVVTTAYNDKYRDKFDQSFCQEFSRRVRLIVGSKLPASQHNIKHDGYVIAIESQIERLDRTEANQTWEAIIENSESIPNTSDRALVLSMIAESIPIKPRTRGLIEDVLKKAEEITLTIPTLDDQLDRYESLATAAESVNHSLARQFYRKAMDLLVEREPGSSTRGGAKRLLSMAHRFEPELADSLARIADERVKGTESLGSQIQGVEAREQHRTLKLRQAIADEKTSLESYVTRDPLFPEAAWQALGSLNAGRLSPPSLSRACEMVAASAQLPFSDAYPILAYSVEGLVVRKGLHGSNQIPTRQLFEAAITAAQLAERVVSRVADRQRTMVNNSGEASLNDRLVIIEAGQRGIAIDYVRRWLSSQSPDQILIVDQFFGASDIEAIKLIQESNPTCEISIITSIHQIQKDRSSNGSDAPFLSAWRELSDQSPPNVKIIAIGQPSAQNKSVIHDRWWLASTGGLDFGTSFNGLGVRQRSDITRLSRSESVKKTRGLSEYLDQKKRDYNGERIRYEVEYM